MIESPFLPASTAANEWGEGFTKGFVAIAAPEPSEIIMAEDFEAFKQG